MVKTLPDWWIAKYRPVQTISPYQERLWGYFELSIEADSSIIFIYWNAEEVPEGQPGVAVGVPNWSWLITDSKVTADNNSLIKVSHGVGKLIDGELWMTGEVREYGYGEIDGRLGAGLMVWYDEAEPYFWWVEVYNPNTVPIYITHYLNGIAEYRPMEKRTKYPRLIKLDVSKAIKLIENKEPYKAFIAIGNKVRKYGIVSEKAK